MDKPEMSTSSSTISLQEYLAACIEVVRGKLGQEVEIMVYVHKVIEDIVVLSTKSMHATALPAASVFASSQAMRIKKTEDGAVTVTTADGSPESADDMVRQRLEEVSSTGSRSSHLTQS